MLVKSCSIKAVTLNYFVLIFDLGNVHHVNIF